MPKRGTTRRELEEHSFQPIVTLLVLVLSLFLGIYVPHIFPRLDILDLPLIIVIYFAVSWRSPIAGTLLGAITGIAQDLPTNGPIGIHGIAKCIVGYAAASISLRVDVENTLTRVLFSFGLSLLQSIVLYVIRHWMLDMPEYSLMWLHELLRAAVTTAIALPVFFILDRTRSES